MVDVISSCGLDAQQAPQQPMEDLFSAASRAKVDQHLPDGALAETVLLIQQEYEDYHVMVERQIDASNGRLVRKHFVHGLPADRQRQLLGEFDRVMLWIELGLGTVYSSMCAAATVHCGVCPLSSAEAGQRGFREAVKAAATKLHVSVLTMTRNIMAGGGFDSLLPEDVVAATLKANGKTPCV